MYNIPDYKKWKDRETKISLIRKSPRKVKVRKNLEINKLYRPLIDSFTRYDFITYEKYHHSYGSPGRKKEEMLIYLDEKDIKSGPIRELAEIRSKDLKLHQKLYQMLKDVWMDLKEFDRYAVNSDPDKFFKTVAMQILKGRTKKIQIQWHDTDAFANEIKRLYKKQNGLCAITGEPLELILGKSKANPDRLSVDRIDSSKGYIRGNIWVIKWYVNCMKSDMDLNTFKNKIEIIHNKLNNAEIL